MSLRYTGMRALKAGLVSDTYLEASDVYKHKESYENTTISEEMKEKITEAAESEDIYSNLARSIAPEIYGHEDVKKALLLMLIGGSVRVLPDGMRYRTPSPSHSLLYSCDILHKLYSFVCALCVIGFVGISTFF